MTYPKPLSEDEILRGIRDQSLYGIVECDVSCKDENHYKDFPPIFKHAQVSRSDIGPYMEAITEKLGTFKTPRKYLISSLFAEKQMFSTGEYLPK